MYLYTLIMPNFQRKKIPLCRKVGTILKSNRNIVETKSKSISLKHIYRTRPFISMAMYIHFGKQWPVSIRSIWNYQINDYRMVYVDMHPQNCSIKSTNIYNSD
jgi:hypothetical protein